MNWVWSLLPYPKEVGFLPRGGRLGLLGERLDVVDGEDGGGDEPGEPEHGLDDDYDGQNLGRKLKLINLLQKKGLGGLHHGFLRLFKDKFFNYLSK